MNLQWILYCPPTPLQHHLTKPAASMQGKDPAQVQNTPHKPGLKHPRAARHRAAEALLSQPEFSHKYVHTREAAMR
jgi:hypothetical protein